VHSLFKLALGSQDFHFINLNLFFLIKAKIAKTNSRDSKTVKFPRLTNATADVFKLKAKPRKRTTADITPSKRKLTLAFFQSGHF